MTDPKPQPLEQDPETGAIVLCAFRYALGRRTYMPSLVAEWIMRHWTQIPANDKDRIFKELGEELHGEVRNLGDACDVATWTQFYRWMKQRSDLDAQDQPQKRSAPASIAGKGETLGNIVSPIVDEEEWEPDLEPVTLKGRAWFCAESFSLNLSIKGKDNEKSTYRFSMAEPMHSALAATEFTVGLNELIKKFLERQEPDKIRASDPAFSEWRGDYILFRLRIYPESAIWDFTFGFDPFKPEFDPAAQEPFNYCKWSCTFSEPQAPQALAAELSAAILEFCNEFSQPVREGRGGE